MTPGRQAMEQLSGTRSRGWAIVGALSITETVSWGILYYAFAVFLVPMQRDLGFSAAQLTGAFSVALVVSGIAGIAAGHYLDRRGPRALMTLGSSAGVVLVLVWSQVHSLEAFYALWLAIGLVMAAVLYEPAFAVLAKWFPDAEERRRAMTAMTLVAALASFIFLPLTQALIDAHGWRHALVILAVILGVITVPLHGLILRSATVEPRAPTGQGTELSIGAGEALRSAAFWRLSGAFFLATVTGIAMTVHAIPFLLQRGYGAGFAAFAVGLVGLSQIPGRVLFVALAGRLPRAQATAGVFLLIAAGIALIVSVDASSAVLAGLVLLGMGNGMATLARATAIADIYGAGAYGTIAGVTGAMTTAARGVGPVTAALWATAVGYSALLWTLVVLSTLAAGLAYRAESG
jgi:predicted MFS family arabinose efflux permease